ncbi:DNA-binding transcriptional regulator, MarR family [Sesbania bispinosa]|nr:DNA-binding transcriptional regulator, MarR family [Sesbania bispinosa]
MNQSNHALEKKPGRSNKIMRNNKKPRQMKTSCIYGQHTFFWTTEIEVKKARRSHKENLTEQRK